MLVNPYFIRTLTFNDLYTTIFNELYHYYDYIPFDSA